MAELTETDIRERVRDRYAEAARGAAAGRAASSEEGCCGSSVGCSDEFGAALYGDEASAAPGAAVSASLGVDDAGVAQLLEVVRQGGLADGEQRDQLAHADLAGVLAQDVDELQPDGVAERLGDVGHALSLLALDVGVDDGFAAGLAGGALLLGRELKIDSHLCTYID